MPPNEQGGSSEQVDIELTATDDIPTNEPVEDSEAIGSAAVQMEAGSAAVSLTEAVQLTGEYDPTRNTWPVCFVEAGVGKNRRQYRPDVLAAAAHLYEGLDVYDAHQDDVEDDKPRKSRPPRELLGFVQGVRFDPKHNGHGGLVGEILITNPARQQECAYPQYRRRVGFSHDVNVPKGKTSMERVDGALIEDVLEIASATSVDFVLNPAAGGRFMEEHQTEEVNMTELTELKDKVAEQAATILELKEGQRVATARDEVTRLLEAVTDLPLAAKHRVTDTVVGAVQLSETAKVEDLVKAAAETERTYLAEVAKPAQPDNAGVASDVRITESRQAFAAGIYNDMKGLTGLWPIQPVGGIS